MPPRTHLTALAALALTPLALAALSSGPARAASQSVKVPDRYDGDWSIEAATRSGPCAASSRYEVRIHDSDVSYPGGAVAIDGGVSDSGDVRATIVRGSVRVPITGSLDAGGTGRGTWHSTGSDLFACSGSWSARRGG